MNQYVTKLRLIFLPFLTISIATIIVYTFLHWLLFIKTVIMPVDEDILNLIAPMIFAGIPILIWLRPKIKLLNLKNKNGKVDPLMGYIMFAWMAMLPPLVISQNYLTSATGKLTSLDNINQIDKYPATKYYKAKHFYIDKSLTGFYTRFEVSGKYNEHFDMYIYAAVPMYDTLHSSKTHNFKISSPKSPINSNNALLVLNGKVISKNDLYKINPRSIKDISVLKGAAAVVIYGDIAKNGAILIKTNLAYSGPDTLASVHDDDVNFTPFAWIGVKFEKTISNKLSRDEKEEAYKAFAKESQDDFNSKRLNEFVYLDRINYSTDQKNYLKAIANDRYYHNLPSSPIVLTSVNEPYEARTGHELPWIFGSLAIGSAVIMLLLLFKPLREDFEQPIENTKKSDNAFKDIKMFFWPRKGFYVTPIIINLNIFIFIVMVFAGLGFISFQASDLLKWGGNFRPAINNGEYWRLFTNMFLHGGLMHVLMNMYGLFFVGLFLEPLLEQGKYLLIYLVTGIIASIASVWWHPATVSIGASGAIFGLYGAFFALLTVNVFPNALKKPFLINTSIFIGYNLLFGLTGGIDNAAHIGGLLSGLILGYAMYPLLKDKVQQEEADAETHELLNELNDKPGE